MRKYSSVDLLKYLLPVIFLSLIIVSCNYNKSPNTAAVNSQPADTEKAQTIDTGKTQLKDTASIQVKDSGKIQVKDSGNAQLKDTGNVQVKDTGNLQGIDSLNIQVKDSLPLQSKDTAAQQLPDSIVYLQHTFTGEEIVRGERLFYGLAYLGSKSVNCASCHNTRVSDTLNWNPDALEISLKFEDKSAQDLSKVLLKPVGQKMKLVHKGFQLTAEDIILIKAYMNEFVDIGLKQDKPAITYLLLFIIASLLFLVSSADVIIKKIFKNQRINYAILTVTGIFITWVLAVNAVAFGRSKGYSPDQPIKFSHAVHAGQNKTDCNYCHYSAKTSKTAGIPAGSICYNCHLLVRNGTRSGATEIAKVIGALEEKKAVEWKRIYQLPDFVFFSHAQHVSAGEINCEACHGAVKEMDRLYQVPDLSMGWCIDCHKTRKVNLTNEYYKTYYPGFSHSLASGKIDSVMVTAIGGRDCGKCHY